MRIDNISKVVLQKQNPSVLTRGQLRIANHINENIDGKKPLILSKNILERINLILLGNSSHTELIDMLSRLGKNITDTILRKLFITEFAGKNTFYLSRYEHALKANGSKSILDAFNFKKLLNSKKKDSSNTSIKNKFYSMVAIIYSYGNIETAEKFLKPLFIKILKNCDDSFITNFFKQVIKNLDKNFNISILKNADNTHTGILDFENIHLCATAQQQETVLLNLYKKFMCIKKLFPFQNFVKHDIKSSPTKEMTEFAEIILEKTGFKPKSQTVNSRVFKPHEYILNALSPNKRLELMSINHQKFEYYGDAVSNMLTERFLLVKNIDKRLRHSLYKEMTSNQTFGEFFNKIGLNSIITNGKNLSEKEKADVFEAFIGALHFSYPEDKVYNYLMPLFNTKYNELTRTI